MLTGGSKGSIHSQASEPVVRLVLFVGGVTMAEIAAIRFLAIPQDDGGQYLSYLISLNAQLFFYSC
jgi:hypothetical protein